LLVLSILGSATGAAGVSPGVSAGASLPAHPANTVNDRIKTNAKATTFLFIITLP